MRQVDLSQLRASGDCAVGTGGELQGVAGARGDATAVLCGRNAVQLSPPHGSTLSLEDLAKRLAGVGRLERNAFLLRLAVDGYVLTVFPDGRTIVAGTNDIATARTLHARYIGA
jgi:adenylyltransferase/sulfurtransferase